MYNNPTSSRVYFHATAPDASLLNKLSVKMYALDDPEDEDGMVQMTP